MTFIKDLSEIQDLDQKQQILIIGGKTEETKNSGSIRYKLLDFPTCPLTQFPDGTVGHLCPGEPKPKPSFEDPINL